MLRHRRLWIRTRIGVGRGNVILVDRLIVDVYLAAIDANAVARHTDDPFDIDFGRVARIAELHNIAALNRLQPVDKFIHEDPFLVFERGHHARALHFHRLVEKDDDEGGDRQRDDEIAHPDADPCPKTHRSSRYRHTNRAGWRRGRSRLAG